MFEKLLVKSLAPDPAKIVKDYAAKKFDSTVSRLPEPARDICRDIYTTAEKELPKFKERPGFKELPGLKEELPQAVEKTEQARPDGGDEPNKIKTINSQLEGEKHPDTGIPYERTTVELPGGEIVEGVFPEFPAEAEVQLDPNENGDYTGSRVEHEAQANEKLRDQLENNPDLKDKFTEEQLEQIKNGETPDGYTWHHHQDPGKMQLVRSDIHAATRHTGGYALWGKEQTNESA